MEEEAAVVRIGCNFRIKQLKEEINVLMDRETRMWNQRSRILWLKNGDVLAHSQVQEIVAI